LVEKRIKRQSSSVDLSFEERKSNSTRSWWRPTKGYTKGYSEAGRFKINITIHNRMTVNMTSDKISKRQKLPLILEKEGAKLWGRVLIGDNLIVDSASSLQALEKKLKKTILNFECLDQLQFEYTYDLTVFFEKFDFLNQSKIAELAGLNPSLIRQYSSGLKQPSRDQVRKIQNAIRTLAGKLKSVRLSSKSYAY
jgi:hypothetical protein